MRNITIIKFEWDCLGGFDFTVLNLEFEGFEGSLFSIYSRWNKRLILEILFIRFDISKPFT